MGRRKVLTKRRASVSECSAFYRGEGRSSTRFGRTIIVVRAAQITCRERIRILSGRTDAYGRCVGRSAYNWQLASSSRPY